MDNQLYEIKGYYRNVLNHVKRGEVHHKIMELIIVDESTISKLSEIFSIAENEHVDIKVLSVIGYYYDDPIEAFQRAEAIEDSMNDTNSISFDLPKIIFGVSDPNDPNINYYGKITYSLHVEPPEDIPTNTSGCWQITLGKNINLLNPRSPRRLLALEMGHGTFIQYSNEDCGNNQTYEREFIYGTLGVAYSVIPSSIPDTTFMTLIQKFISKVGINLNLFSNSFEIENLKFDGGFVTSKLHKLEDFGNALIINCTVAFNLSAFITAATSCSLVVIVIPIHDDDGIRGELVGTIIAGNGAGVTFDTKITANMSLSLTAGFIHLL